MRAQLLQDKQGRSRQLSEWQRSEPSRHAHELGRESDQDVCGQLLHRQQQHGAAQRGQHDLGGKPPGQQHWHGAGVSHLLPPVAPGQPSQEGCRQPEESAAGRPQLCQAHTAVPQGWARL